jgi:hypothetical protein
MGYALAVVYVAGVGVVVALYPLCQWFGRLKQRCSDAWLSYIERAVGSTLRPH